MSDVVDLEAARTARAEATVAAELERLSGPRTVEDKIAILAASINTISISILELHKSLARVVVNQSLAFDLIDNLNARLVAVEKTFTASK